MSISGTLEQSFVVESYDVLLTYDGNTFDANQVRFPTLVEVDGETFMFYSGLANSNGMELGLAIDDGSGEFERYSDDPIVASSQEPFFASFRVMPATVLFEDGVFKLWFTGTSANIISESQGERGWGYATSTDGINWTFAPDAIRSEVGAYQSNTLREVIKFQGTYFAYYNQRSDQSGDQSRFWVTTSTDGVNFSNDQTIAPMGGSTFIRTGIAFEDQIISIWRGNGEYFTAVSDDGINFTRLTALELPTGFVPGELKVDGDTVTVTGHINEGNILWNFGNLSAVEIRIPLEYFVPLDDPIIVEGGKGDDSVVGGNNDDILEGGNGNDEIVGASGDDNLNGGNGSDQITGGNGEDTLLGGNGDDLLQGGLGHDVISGGNGADSLIGDVGNDTLIGGNGSDVFVFDLVGDASEIDTIDDFSQNDLIRVQGDASLSYSDISLVQTTDGVIVSVGSVSVLLIGVDEQQLDTSLFDFV